MKPSDSIGETKHCGPQMKCVKVNPAFPLLDELLKSFSYIDIFAVNIMKNIPGTIEN